MKKRGQVTVFIIIGIIILLIVGALFVFKSQIKNAQLELALKQDKAEGEAVAVQEFVSSCLNDVSIDALELLGQHGGYINLSRSDLHNRDFSIEDNPTSSDAVTFNNLEIPYWWYEDSEHGCTRCSITTKNVPTIETMELQVNAYVEEQLNTCLNNFESMKGFTVTQTSEPVAETTVSSDSVYIQLTYPVTITKEGVTTQLENWYVEVPVPLQQIYDSATEILTMQVSDQFLEQITINIISAYSGLDENRLPPLAAFTEGYTVVYWVKTLVKEQLQQYLNTYVPLIQIQGTSASVDLEPSTEYGEGFFTLLYRESLYPFEKIKADFIYDNFDYYMDITPSSGELIKPNTYSQEFPVLIPTIQTNHYQFYYDVSYPVVVSLRDDTALNGAGYTFLFGLEANLRDNRNLIQWAQGKGTFGEWNPDLVEIGLKSGVSTEYPIGFDVETNETIYGEFEPPEKTLMCDYEQRLSGEVSVAVYDGLTSEPINGASVAFKCGVYETCSIGASDATGHYDGSFPVCIGGAVKIEADGYYTNYVNLDTVPKQENSVIALLEPFKELPVNIKFIPTARLNESLSASSLRSLAFDMDTTDSVLLTLEKVPDQLYESSYSQVVSVTKAEESTIQLVSGTYTVSVLLLDEEGVYIPARTEKYGGEEVEYPEVEMETGMLGGVDLVWEVDSTKLHNAESVTFYVFRINDPHYIEDLGELGMLGNYSVIYSDVVVPSFD